MASNSKAIRNSTAVKKIKCSAVSFLCIQSLGHAVYYENSWYFSVKTLPQVKLDENFSARHFSYFQNKLSSTENKAIKKRNLESKKRIHSFHNTYFFCLNSQLNISHSIIIRRWKIKAVLSMGLPIKNVSECYLLNVYLSRCCYSCHSIFTVCSLLVFWKKESTTRRKHIYNIRCTFTNTYFCVMYAYVYSVFTNKLCMFLIGLDAYIQKK